MFTILVSCFLGMLHGTISPMKFLLWMCPSSEGTRCLVIVVYQLFVEMNLQQLLRIKDSIWSSSSIFPSYHYNSEDHCALGQYTRHTDQTAMDLQIMVL